MSSSQELSSQESSSTHSWSQGTPPPKAGPRPTLFNQFKVKTLSHTAEALDRTGVSSTAAAYIINSYQADVSGSKENLLDPCKLNRDKDRLREDKLSKQEGKMIVGLGIDGRKD